MRTYLYKLTSDRGGAPCAPFPGDGQDALLTLSICKPAIRRTAQPGDRVVGLSSRALEASDGYPLGAVIYAAVVERGLEPREYYAARGEFRHRPDCIYTFHRLNGTITHAGRTRLHDDPAYEARDIGRYPFYKNARTLVCREYRYFGSEAVVIPEKLAGLKRVVAGLGQGHRVFDERSAEAGDLDALFQMLWRRQTRYTAGRVEEEAPGHAPR